MPFKPLSCIYGKLVIPQRYVMMIMLHLMLLNAYHLRVVLNIAIHEILEPRNFTEAKYDSCPEFTFEKMEVTGGTHTWPPWLEAFILYAFYIGYVLTQIPGGWLADKLGARHVLGTSILISVIATLAMPLGIKYGGHKAAIVLRTILGFVQGPIYPTLSSFLQSWAPIKERSFIGGTVFGGSSLGGFTGNLFTGMIIRGTKSWPMAFYVWGLLALLWYIFYMFMVFSRPSSHPFITEEELNYLKEEMEEKKEKFAVPWGSIVTSLPVWAIFCAQFCHNFVFFTLVTNLPKYMKDILKLNISDNAIYSSIPFLALWFSAMIFARLCSFILREKIWKVVTLRKVYTIFGCLVPTSCILTAGFVGCNRLGAIILYTTAMAMISPFYSGTFININDLTHHYAGIIMALVNGIASTAGIIGPFIVGKLTPHGALFEWFHVFWIMFAVGCFSATMFGIFAKAERQEWDFPAEEEKAQ